MRSSTPPWPGMSAARSFTPALRLSSDSNRSPTMPSATIAGAEQREQRDRRVGKTQRAADDQRERAEDEAADRPFDGLLRADRRRQRPAAERAAGVVLRRVADDDRQHQQEQHALAPASDRAPPRARRAAGRCRAIGNSGGRRVAQHAPAPGCAATPTASAPIEIDARSAARRRAPRHEPPTAPRATRRTPAIAAAATPRVGTRQRRAPQRSRRIR